MTRTFVIGIAVALSLGAAIHFASADDAVEPAEKPTRQAILWTSGDPDVAHRMALMYAGASQDNGWYDQNMLIIWGPSARLLAGDKDLQAKVKELMEKGVDVKACIVCANSYGVTQQFRDMGIEVRGMGKPLAELQQSGWDVLAL